MQSGDDVPDRDFGDKEIPPNTGDISGTVYDDLNGNGVWDDGEPGIGGVEVCLYEGSGTTTLVECTTTDPNGNYSFPDVEGGDYTVVETDPPGYNSSSPNELDPVTVVPGETTEDVDFFDYVPASVSGTVFDDLNGNGQPDPGEPGIPGVKVCLNDAGGEIGCVDTDPLGNYSFDDLLPGDYSITETDPAGYISTGDADGPANGDNQIDVTLQSGDVKTDQDFGDQALGSIVAQSSMISTATACRIRQNRASAA